MRKQKVGTTTPSPSENVEKRKEEKSVISSSSHNSSVEVSHHSTVATSSAHSVRFSVLGLAGITVNAPHLEKLQKMEGDKESSYFSSPSKMKAVVTITSDNKVVGITDLSKALTPAHSTFQKESGQHRHLAFWANEQELTLGSGMNLQSCGAETFHMTIGLTDGILPAMPIGTACLVLDAKQMMEDGRIAAVLDLPIQTAADKKMISVDSHVATNAKKKKKKKWFTRSTKEPSRPQQIDFHSVYATDKTGDAILRIQIHLKPEEPELSVGTTVDNTVESESSEVKSMSNSDVRRHRTAEVQRHRTTDVPRHRTSEVQRNRTAEVQRNRTAEVQRNRTAEVTHTIIDLDESVADSESHISIEDNILEANIPEGTDKGISIEEYNMFQVLAQKRSPTVDKRSTGVLYDTTPQQKQEETKEAEVPPNSSNIVSMFRSAMDMAISNFFTDSQPAIDSSPNVKADTGPQEEGIEISLPSFTKISELSATLNHENGHLNYSLESPIIQPTEEVDLASQKTDTDVSNSLQTGTENTDESKKTTLTAREQMVQNLEKKGQPSNLNTPTSTSNQEEKHEDPIRVSTAPQHAETAGRSQGLPTRATQAAKSGLPPRPGGRPPRPTTSRPPLPPTQVRTIGRDQRDPNIPTSILAGPINKSWTLLDDDTYTLTVEGNFQVAPGTGHPETKEGEPGLYESEQHHNREIIITQDGATGFDQLFRCAKPEDVPSMGGKEVAKLKEQAMKMQHANTHKKLDDDEVSLRVPAVIIQYDHMSVANDDLTVDTRDFIPLKSRDGRKHRNRAIPKRPAPRSRTMKKRPNRTIGPDDESAGSDSAEDSISAFIKEVDMQLFDGDEVESLLRL